MAKKDYVVGSGNVFEDLGYPRPAEALAKAELARKIGALIAKRGLTQAAAAEVLQVDQPKVSALVRGRLAGFSLDRLVRFLVLLGSDVEIVGSHAPERRAGPGSWWPEGSRFGASPTCSIRDAVSGLWRFEAVFARGPCPSG